ncbi:Glutathione synthetase [Prochlorococcus marinus str. MIT 1313]|uniref:glutathione synthase n=1 Tax=Prochlorococcus TaxID=1218 RepID=UPI0007BB9229|nr:glutathione synthase [Prochlorococcus marinus]KZR68678.1 Glutathione synthetase [Prochlorococcus marinus str. MIT 1313]KZR71086.1 Glutathione synthetase [Prochlorococcus marinus str. MIT 1318]
MRQLFVLDPLQSIQPAKDSSAALMQAAQRASIEVWACTPADLQARGDQLSAIAIPVVPEPWISTGEPRSLPLKDFACIWMRKDPPVDEGYLYATHLLELAERAGVCVLNRPAALRAWNEKLGALRFNSLMAPTLVASRVSELAAFAREQEEVVLKPLAGRAGQGLVRVVGAAPGLEALLELVTDQEQLPVMVQRFLPAVIEGDKRILLVDGEPLGAVNRRPKAGDFRSNLAMGGRPEPTELDSRELQICAELAPVLREQGLFFVGIDVIDGLLSEINVTSPTGIREVERLKGVPLADQVIARLLVSLG